MRRFSVMVMLTREEKAKLKKLADDADLPMSTLAYQILARSLRRRK